MAYCRNCGNALSPAAAFCGKCGVTAPKGTLFCQNCGVPSDVLAEVCVHCGSRLAKAVSAGKSKVAAILIAAFLSYWTWVYTYRRDKKKFWAGLVVELGAMASSFWWMFHWITNIDFASESLPFPRLGGTYILMLAGSFAGFGIRVWSVLDAAFKPEEWYREY